MHCELTESPAVEPAPWSIDPPLDLLKRLAAQQIIGNGLCGLGEVLRSAMPDRLRELTALRVAVVRESAYIWGGHCHIALHLGLTVDDIAGVALGPDALDGRDAAALALVDDVLSRRRARTATRRLLGDADVLGIVVTTGFYDVVATIMHGAEPEPSVTPIAGLETPAHARATYPAPDAQHCDLTPAAR